MKCFIAAVLAASLLLAQEPEPDFRVGTQLVQVDVVVKAKNVPVTGLTKDDFEVFDNGKRQQIDVFSVREAVAEAFTKVELPPGVVSNRPLYRGPESVTATVILFDALNTPPDAQGYTRIEALKYLDNASRNELIAVYVLGMPMRVLLPFTDDRARIREMIDGFQMSQSLLLQDGPDGLLEGLTGNAAVAANINNMQHGIDFTTAALERIGHQLKGLPGRKKLIWITAGIAPARTFITQRNGLTMHEYYDVSAKLYAPIKMLNDANVAVYPVDPRGVMTCEGPCGPDRGLADPGITMMLHYAQQTGGKALYNDNGIAELIDEAVRDTDLTYTIGFYSTEEKKTAKQHNLRVRVKRSGVETQYRQNYSNDDSGKPVADKLRNGTLSGWMQESLDATEIPIFAEAVPVPNKPGYYEVAVRIDVNAVRLEEKKGRFAGSVELAIAPDVASKPKGLRQTIAINLKPETLPDVLNGGFVVLNQIRIADANGKLLSKRLHVVVMDNATARAGSLRIPLGEK